MERVMEVMRTKHPDAPPPPSSARLDYYTGRPPELVSVDIRECTIIDILGRLYRGAGARGADSVILKH